MRSTIVLTATAATLTACTHAATVTQTGVVPAPRPLAYDGQPLGKPLRLEARYTRVLTALEPNDDRPTGDYIARDHVGFAVRRQAPGSPGTDVGAAVDLAWAKAADAANTGLPAAPKDAAWSVTVGARHAIAVAPDVRVGLGVDLGFVTVPIRMDGSSTERDEALTMGACVVPSWRSGPLAVFGGLHVVSEVDVPRTLVVDDSSDAPEARADGAAVVLAAGASIELDSGVHLQGQLAKPLASEYGDHGVQLDLALGFDLGAPQTAAALASP